MFWLCERLCDYGVDAKIIEIDADKQKVSLSIRALLEEVAAAEAAMPEELVEEAAAESAE